MRHLVFVGVALMAGVVAFAGTERPVTGQWHGRLQIDMSSLPRIADKRQDTKRNKYIQALEQASLTLTLKGDHTYSLMVVRPGYGTQRFAGRWTRNRSSLTIEQVLNGKYSGSPQVFTLDKAEKTMMLANTNSGVRSTVTYSR